MISSMIGITFDCLNANELADFYTAHEYNDGLKILNELGYIFDYKLNWT